MRVAMITGEYPPMEGGVGAFTHQLGLALVALGHRVDVLTSPAPGSAARVTTEDGITVHRTISRWGPGSLVRMREWVRRIAPDAINLQYEPAAYGMRGSVTLAPSVLGPALGAPLVVTFHDLLPPYLFPRAGALRQRSVWHLARRANGVIATNREDLGQLRLALQDEPGPIRLIPIGSNISASPPDGFDRDLWRARLGFSDADLVVGFFGFLNRTKGIETLVTSIAELGSGGMPVHLLLIGGRTGTSDATNAAYAKEVDALIERLGVTRRVHRTGFASPEEVSAALLSVDLVALPYREGANLRHGTLHAALAHGCAIVTTAPSVPVPEFQDRENLILIQPDDARALSRAILALAADGGLRRELGRGAADLAAQFTWPKIAAETAAFFETLR